MSVGKPDLPGPTANGATLLRVTDVGIYPFYDFFDQFFPELTVTDQGANHMAIDGTAPASSTRWGRPAGDARRPAWSSDGRCKTSDG